MSAPRLFDRLERVQQRLVESNRLFLGLDFDGTLSPHVDDPTAAVLARPNRRALDALSRRDAVDIAVVSGRALDDVRNRVGIETIEYAGNHGLELEDDSVLEVTQYRTVIDTVCDRLETRLSACLIENKAITATVHFRAVEAETETEIRQIVEEVIDAVDAELRLTTGTNIIEIRPALDWDKGDAVEWLSQRCRGDCLSVYIGDDTTDEDAFRAIEPEGIGIHVGTETTAASYRVADVEEVAAFLRWLDETGVDALDGENMA